jgi:mono/diheme cytochrome c family protein
MVRGVVTGIVALASTSAPAATLPLFAQRCAMCHQANGAGLPGQFPRLSGRAATLAQSPAGRHYLVLVMLHGIVGSITVDGQPIAGLMPSMAALPDADLAAILNHIAQLAPPAHGKKPAPFTATEIAAARKAGSVGASGVATERAKLAAAGQIP